MAKRSARRLRLRRALRILLLIALLGSVLYLLLEKSLTQVILNTAYAKAYAIAVETMNEAVRESLQSGAAYEDLITVRTDGAGRITMLAANTARMNELAVSVALRAQSALETRDSASIAVPLGAALKAPFFSSLGPRVPVRLSPVGSVSAAFATSLRPRASTRPATRSGWKCARWCAWCCPPAPRLWTCRRRFLLPRASLWAMCLIPLSTFPTLTPR